MHGDDLFGTYRARQSGSLVATSFLHRETTPLPQARLVMESTRWSLALGLYGLASGVDMALSLVVHALMTSVNSHARTINTEPDLRVRI
jgi:hypothetical protein